MEENQENGTANGGDVPEIELIIKEEFIFTLQTSPDEQTQYKESDTFAHDIKDNPSIIQTSKLDCDDTGKDNKKVASTVSVAESVVVVKKEEEEEDVAAPEIELMEPVVCETESTCDSTNTNFISMIAEACEGLFDDIENDLDLNLRTETNSALSVQTKISDCREAVAVKRDSESLRMAVAAVIDEGMSLGQAAMKYKVVKSTIWSRVSKHPKHRRRKFDRELEEVIHAKLSAGESLSEISRSLNIAKSTVHQHKTRLTKHGRLPPDLLLKKDREGGYNAELQKRLTQAHRAYRVNGMSVRFAAEFYSVPVTTLWRFIKRRKPQPSYESSKSGVKAEFWVPENDATAELNPEDQQLFEDTYLNHLFEYRKKI